VLSIDTSEVHALAADIRTNAAKVPAVGERIVAKVGFDVTATAQVNAPVEFGVLQSSISVDVDGMSFEAGPTAEYGGWVELGTDGPYLIENAFGWGIAVEHPGNAPQPYLAPAFDFHEMKAVEAFAQLGERILR
jgi:hypothetical protein